MPDAIPILSDPGQLTERELFHQWLNPEGSSRQFDAHPNPKQQRASRASAVDSFTRDLPATSGSAFGRNVAKGYLNIGATSLGFFEALSDILGAKGAKAFYKEKGDRLAELNAAIPVEIESVTDIGSFADAGGYAAMAVGQLAPQIATSLLGGLAARGLAAGRSAFTQLAATIGGAVVPSTIQESGGIYRGTRDETGVEAPLTSLALGSVSGALEAITPARFLLKVLTTGTDELKKKAASSLLRQTAKEIIKSSGTEMGTEVAQESIALAANKFADSTYKLMTPQNAWRIVDAGLMGLVGGAALGSIEPTVERAINHVKQQEESNAVKSRTQQKDDSGERQRTGSQLQTDAENRAVASEVVAAGTTAIGGDSNAQGEDVAPPIVAPQRSSPRTGIVPASPQPFFAPPPVAPPISTPEPAPTEPSSAPRRQIVPGSPQPFFRPPPLPAKPTAPATPSPQVGKQFEVSTPDASVKLNGAYEVVGLGDLVTSFDTGFDQNLQPRDRNRQASDNQITEIVRKFEPQRYGESPTSDMGAPIIDELNQVVSGNGRSAALRVLYGADRAGGYKDWIVQNSARFGLDPAFVSGIEQPVLVRRITDYKEAGKPEFARLSNQQQVLGMGEAEKAGADARMIMADPSLLDLFLPSDDGNVLAASNRPFLNRFIQGTGDQASLLTKDGYNATVLAERVKQAVFASLIGPENKALVSRLLEGAEELGMKTVANGLISVAPRLVRLKGAAYDLSPLIEKALTDLTEVRSRGEKLEEFLGSQSLFSDPTRTAETDRLLSFFSESKSSKQIADGLSRYARLAQQAILDEQSGGLLGGQPLTREQILNAIYERTKTEPTTQEDLTLGKSEKSKRQPTRPPPKTPPGGAGPAGAIAAATVGQVATPAPTAQTIPEFKARVTASNLSPEAKTFINAFLDSKAAKYLEGARFRIAEAIDNGWQGSYWQGLIQLAETAEPGVAPQEFMHRIFDLLPLNDRASIGVLRQRRIAELKAQFPNDPLLTSIAANPTSTADFVAANPTDQQIIDFYPVINNDEFFAHMMSDKFTGAVKGKPALTLVARIREVLKDIIAAIKKAFKLPVTADQMFKNIMAGRYDVKPAAPVSEEPRGAVLPITRKETIQKVAAFVKPGELPTEALLATGQVTSPRNILERILSALPKALRDKAGQILGFRRMDDISQYVAIGLGQSPADYTAARTALPDEGTKNLLAVHSNRGLELFEQEGEKTRSAFLRQKKEISSPAFASKFRTYFKLKTKEEATRDARQAIELTIKNGLDKAIRRVREAGANDALFESADNERQFYESLSGRTSELLSEMQAIVQGPTFPGTLAASATPTAAEILAHYYQAVPRPAPNSVTGRNERAAVQRIAAEILSRSKTLRDRMLAAFWSESNELLKPVANVEEQVTRDIQTMNPATVIGKLVRDAGSLNRAEGRAAFVFLQKHREMTRKLLQFEEFQAAVQAFDAVMADPEYRAIRTLVAKDAKAEVRPVGAQGIELGTSFYSKGEIYLPSGEIVTLNMFPDKPRFDTELSTKLSRALDELNAWLLDPDNQDAPTRAFYQRQYNQFKTLWWSSSALNPSKQVVAFRNTVFKLMDSLLGMAGPMLKSIGTRNVVLVKSAMAIWKDMNHYTNDWLAKWHPRIVEANGKAAKSHPEIWEGQDRGAAVEEWHAKVFTPLAASVQDPNRKGYKVGDVIPESGETVTAEDMAALQLQSQSGRELYQLEITKGRRGIPLPNLVEDRFIPGAKHFRSPSAAAANVVTRRYSQSARNVADSFIALLKTTEAMNAADATAAITEFWDNHFEFVKSAVVNRDAQYSTLTDFESVLEAAKTEIRDGNITNVQELLAFIQAHTTESEETIRNWLFGELSRHATAIAREIKTDPNLIGLETVEDANPFTVGRGAQVAPPAWYSYGFSDSRSIYNFSMSGSNFYFEILIKSLNGLKESLAAEIDRANTELDTLAAQMGRSKAQSTQRKQNREDMRLGQQTADLENLQDFHRGLEKLILDLNQRFSPGGKRLEEDFGLANKAWSGILGNILSSINTVTRNAFEGGFIHNGFLMSRLFGSTLQGFPRAFFGLMQSLIKVGASGLWSLPRAALKLHPIAGVSSLITSRNLIEAERTMFGDAMTELATTMYGRIQMFRDLESAGLGMPAYPNELLAASAQFPLTFGQITERPYADTAFGRLLQSIGPAALSMIDAQISLFLRPTLPRAGDQIANLAVANTTLGAIHTLEARLRKLFSVYRSAGKNAASLAGHIFTPTEILGRWFGLERTQTNLKEIEDWFTGSLVPFHDSITDYFGRLETDPGAKWLTPEDKLRLVTTSVETVNLATPENRPLAFRKNLPMRVVGALMGWNVKMLRNSVDFFTGIAASDPRYSQMQLRIAVYTMFLATLAWSALGQAGIEEILRFLSRTLNDEERPTRQPWEQEGAGDQLKGWTIYAFNSIPFVATAANVAFSDLPNKAGFSPTLLAQQKVIDVLNYAAGAVRTRDITYRLPQLVRGFFPIAPIFLNRLPGTAGSVEALNVRRLYTRYGDTDLIRKSVGAGAPGLGSTATRLTPYGDRIINALAKGDFDEAAQIKSEAVKVATGMGKIDPERSVEQMITARLPHRRAFKETLSQGQMANVLAKMSQGEREQVEKLNSTLKAGLGRLGIETDFVEPEKPARLAIGAGGYGGRSGLRSLRPSAFGRRSRRSRLVGLATGRRRRGLGGRRRRSLRSLV